MAAAESATRRRQPSRLQRRAPASLQINRSTDWNVAIPLLSPVTSPQAPMPMFVQSEIDSRKDGHHHGHGHQASAAGSDQKPAAVFKKWQAAPFCFDPAPLASFVVVDGSRR